MQLCFYSFFIQECDSGEEFKPEEEKNEESEDDVPLVSYVILFNIIHPVAVARASIPEQLATIFPIRFEFAFSQIV